MHSHCLALRFLLLTISCVRLLSLRLSSTADVVNRSKVVIFLSGFFMGFCHSYLNLHVDLSIGSWFVCCFCS